MQVEVLRGDLDDPTKEDWRLGAGVERNPNISEGISGDGCGKTA